MTTDDALLVAQRLRNWLDTDDPDLPIDMAIEARDTIEKLVLQLSSVRPRTLGVDGPPTEWPAWVKTRYWGIILAIEYYQSKNSNPKWCWGSKSNSFESAPEDTYVDARLARALLELDHD